MNPLQRRRARLLIRRAQRFADEPLLAVANFTWVGNGAGSASGREDLAGGLPMWSLVGVGATRLYIVAAEDATPDRAVAPVGSWPLDRVRISEETVGRTVGSVTVGAYRVLRFTFPDRSPAVLQPVGREVDDLLAALPPALPGVRADGLTEVTLMTTAGGADADDDYLVLTYLDGTTTSPPVGQGGDLLDELRALPGFDDETFVRSTGVTVQGMAVLWRANRD